MTLHVDSAPAKGHPGDRPPGAPRAVIPAFASFVFLETMVPNAIVMLTGAFLFGDGIGLFLPSTPVLIPSESVVLIAVVLGLSKGKLWAVRMFRPIGWLTVILYPPLLILAGLGAFGILPMIDVDATGDTVVVGVILGILLPCPFLMAHGLRHVRWLDPSSTSDEWELPHMKERALRNPAQQGLTSTPNLTQPGPAPTPTPLQKAPVPTWMAIVLPPVALYRLGHNGFAAITAILCVIALPALIVSPVRAIVIWLLATSLSLGCLGTSNRPPNAEP